MKKNELRQENIVRHQHVPMPFIPPPVPRTKHIQVFARLIFPASVYATMLYR